MPNVQVYVTEETPSRFAYSTAGPRAGDLVIVPELGWTVVPWSASSRAPTGGWTHGWDPRHEEMHGLFIASGPRVRHGVRIPRFENIHVYPFVVELLELLPNSEIDGTLDVLAPILTGESTDP